MYIKVLLNIQMAGVPNSRTQLEVGHEFIVFDVVVDIEPQ